MIVHVRPYGRLGNQLFFLSHLMAFSLKYGHPFLAPSFGANARYFPWFEGNSLFSYPAGRSPSGWQASLVRTAWDLRYRLPGTRKVEYWEKAVLDFDQVEYRELLDPLDRGETVFYHGWLLRGFDSVIQHRDEICRVFRPAPALVETVQNLRQTWSQDSDVVVGVHVRWEDYRGTENFLSREEFRAHMVRCQEAFAPQKTAFVVFSNENLSEDDFPGLPVSLARGGVMEDLYAMARCDYLLAPPSTFSGWASFYGEVPLLTLSAGSPEWDLSRFRVVRG